jgi:phosphate transport system permease protein
MSKKITRDNLFKVLSAVTAASAAVILIVTAYTLSTGSIPVLQRFGTYFFVGTTWNPVEGREVIRHWVLSYGRSGIFGAVILGLGRAVGETMAVTMVIGNAIGPTALPTSLFKPGQTMSSLIANGFLESVTPVERSAYIGVGLILLLVSLLINIVAHVMVTRIFKLKGGAVE